MSAFRQRSSNRWPHVKAIVAPRVYPEPWPWTSPRPWPLPLAETSDLRTVATELAEGSTEYGSDKATIHDHHTPYARIPPTIPREGSIFEFGIGTNDFCVPSNKGPEAIPGASLRAWLNSGFFSDVVGADFLRCTPDQGVVRPDGALFGAVGLSVAGHVQAVRYTSVYARHTTLPRWVHIYNHHHPHTALGGRLPIRRVTNPPGQDH